jgi:hypothetical protein
MAIMCRIKRTISSDYFNIYTTPFSYIYRVFTKEWCGFKNLLNDYILQLDGAPPPIFTGMYESYSVVFSNSAGSDVQQMETTTYTHYMERIRLSCGCVSCDPGCTHWRIMINALKTWTVAAADGVSFARVRWEISFLLIFETAPFFSKHTVYVCGGGVVRK